MDGAGAEPTFTIDEKAEICFGARPDFERSPTEV
jgi:hypothetical protein